jgi:hypothetical protein
MQCIVIATAFEVNAPLHLRGIELSLAIIEAVSIYTSHTDTSGDCYNDVRHTSRVLTAVTCAAAR